MLVATYMIDGNQATMAAADLTELELQRSRVERRLAAQYAVTRVLAEAGDLEVATRAILEAICATLNWEFGALWTIDERGDKLRCVDIWHAPGVDLPRFGAETRERSLARAEGLPGRVWASAESLWVRDVLTETNFPRAAAAKAEGLRTFFGFPVVSHERTLGVIEFFSREIREPDESLLHMLSATGAQVGQFIERKRAEDALRFQNSVLEAQNEASIDGILILSDDGEILSFNQRFVDVWRLSREAVEAGWNTPILEVVRKQIADTEGFDERMAHLLAHPEERRHDEIALIDGRTIDRYTAPLRAADGTSYGRAWFFRDVTETKRAQEVQRLLIQASSELDASLDFETTLANVAQLALPYLADWCAIALREEDGSIRRVATAHVDPTKRELLETFRNRYTIDPSSHHPIADVIRTGNSQLNPEVGDERMQAVAPDPSHIDMVRELGMASSIIVPLRARGKTIGAMSLMSGSNRRRHSEADLRLAEDLARRAALAVDNARLFQAAQEAVELRDEFLAAASHDLKGPLATIKGLSQLLARYMERTPQDVKRILDGLATIDGATNKMTSMINQLLDVSRLEMGHPLDLDLRRVDLVTLVRRVVGEQQHISDRAITIESEEEELFGLWDPDRVERVLSNLLSNAIKYSPDGGDIVVRMRHATGDESPVDAVALEVQDFGIGIPRADIPRIFERFHRATNVRDRVRGSGIGLASVQQIVKQHGGRVIVESLEGRGSRFTVILPLEPPDDSTDDL